MGCWACKTSHLGKNTLKNRRFLESNNADSGEQVQGLPKSGAELWFRCWRGAESESRLVSPAGCRPVLATDAAISSLFFLEMMPFRQHPHTYLGELASALIRTGPCLSLSPEHGCLPPESSLCTCGPPFLGPPSCLLSAWARLPIQARCGTSFCPRLSHPGLWPYPPPNCTTHDSMLHYLFTNSSASVWGRCWVFFPFRVDFQKCCGSSVRIKTVLFKQLCEALVGPSWHGGPSLRGSLHWASSALCSRRGNTGFLTVTNAAQTPRRCLLPGVCVNPLGKNLL